MILDDTIAKAVANAETDLRPIAQYLVRYSFRGTSGGGDLTNTSNSNRRSLWQSNYQTTPGQTSRSAWAPSILANLHNTSHSTSLC